MNYLTNMGPIPNPGPAADLEIRRRDMDDVGHWHRLRRVDPWVIPGPFEPHLGDDPVVWAPNSTGAVDLWPRPTKTYEVRTVATVDIERMQKAWRGRDPMADPIIGTDEGTSEAKPLTAQEIIDATEPMKNRAEASMEAARKLAAMRWVGYSDDGMPGGAKIPIVVKTEEPGGRRINLQATLDWAMAAGLDVKIHRRGGVLEATAYPTGSPSSTRWRFFRDLTEFREWLISQVDNHLANKPKPVEVDHGLLVDLLKHSPPEKILLSRTQCAYILKHLDPAPPK